MKVTREIVKLFEHDQQTYGTQVAVSNILWLQAQQQLKELGASKVKTDYGKKKRR